MTRVRSLVVAALATLSLAVALVPAGAPAAEAVKATDFDPGMIISDATFYDSSSMTASQIQAFLDAKVPECEEWRDSDPSDITCLKDYRATIAARAANDNCKAISTQTASAAKIIDVVARACGVSQRALLVLLQKEQGLVTHTWPSSYRYDKATGYACPDTPEGCDEKYFGFANQLYMAAWQFKQYRATASSRGYQAGRWNAIQYKPNSTCGTKDVYIQNQATAGLYIYTPYVPNQAALNAGYGVGDSCSSYGNRNFFLYFSDWFGSTGISVDGNLVAAYAKFGGVSVIGAPTAAAKTISANGGGWMQKFEKGTLYRTKGGIETYRASGWAISTAYDASGGPAGPWGFPIAGSVTENGVQVVEFQNVRVALLDGEVVVGYPFSDASPNPDSNDYNEHFASIAWMSEQGLATGWASPLGPEYRPTRRVTRDAVAAFLHRYMEGATLAPAEGGAGDDATVEEGVEALSFVDVTPESTAFYDEIMWLASQGLATGWQTEDGVAFRPTAQITRDAVAAFLYRLAAPEDYVAPSEPIFADVTPTTSAFYTEISWLAEQGISTGWSTGSGKPEFRPTARITRDAMASFLYRFDQLG